MNNLELARAELITRRENIDNAIAGLDRILGLEPDPGPSGGGGRNHKSPMTGTRQLNGKRRKLGERINHAATRQRRGSAPAAAAPAPVSAAGEPGTVIEAIRRICRGMDKGTSFQAADIAEKIAARWPALTEKVNTGKSVAFGFMIEKGELSKTGEGKGTIYKIVAIKPPIGANVSQVESDYRKLREEIQVPRDPENE